MRRCKKTAVSKHESSRRCTTPAGRRSAPAANCTPVAVEVLRIVVGSSCVPSHGAPWCAAALVVALTPALAWSHGAVFVAPLTGPTASSPTTSFGYGLATLSINFDLFTIRVQVNFNDLEAPVTRANLFGLTSTPGEGVGFAALAASSLPGFPLGSKSGAFDQTFDLAQAATYDPAYMAANGGNVDLASSSLIAGMFAGQTYFSVCTANYDNGEIGSFLLTAPEADFNHNGRVDRADLAMWREAYPTGHLGNTIGDANGDVYTDGTDFLIWQRQLGRFASLAGPHGHAPAPRLVPEPHVATTSVIALLALTKRIRRGVKTALPSFENCRGARCNPHEVSAL